MNNLKIGLLPLYVKLYDDIANDGSLGRTERDLATLRAAGLLVDTAPYADLRQRLEPLTAK